MLNHENTFLVSQCFQVSLHFFHLIIEASHQKIDIQHQAKDYLNFKLGKLKEIHRRISRKSNTGGQIPYQQRPLFSGIRWAGGKKTVFGGPEEKKTAGYGADYEVACFFCPLPMYGYYMGFIGNGLFLADFISTLLHS